MKKLYLTLFLSLILVEPIISQSLKLNIYGGGGASNKSYSYSATYGFVFLGTTTENYSIRGYYLWGINISYPIYEKEFGLYIESNNRFSNVSPVSYRSNILTAGIIWRKPISKIEIELLGGYGYSWDNYELTKSQDEKYSITNGMSVFHSGFNVYVPINTIFELSIGGRLTVNNKTHISVSNHFMSENSLKVPSLLYTGIAGISINILNIVK